MVAFYQNLERRFFLFTQKLRAEIYKPLVALCAILRLTPNRITILRAVLFGTVIMYHLFMSGNVFAATAWFLFGFWMIDTLDGEVARATNTASDRGKFIDVFVDQLGYSLFIMGLVYNGFGDAYVLFYHVIISASCYLISTVYHHEGKPTDWIIKPEPNLVIFKAISTSAILVTGFLGYDILTLVLGGVNICYTLLTIFFFLAFIKRHKN